MFAGGLPAGRRSCGPALALPSWGAASIAPVDQRHEPIIVETDRYRIEGKLTLPSEGYRSRLSDYVNQRDREFFSIQDATVTPLDGSGEGHLTDFLLVARRHIRLVVPAEAGR